MKKHFVLGTTLAFVLLVIGLQPEATVGYAACLVVALPAGAYLMLIFHPVLGGFVRFVSLLLSSGIWLITQHMPDLGWTHHTASGLAVLLIGAVFIAVVVVGRLARTS